MQSPFLPAMVRALLTILMLVAAALSAQPQSAKELPRDVISANAELDRQLLEGHRLLDTDKVMGLFSSDANIFFISPDGELHQGRNEVRQSWERFFASLESIRGEINHIRYMPAGDGVIAVGQVTYYRQLKGRAPEQRIVIWTDFRRKENGKWVYVFRHAHWPAPRNVPQEARPPAKSPSSNDSR